uniref:Uncharacterized protein n=1 Tax=Oryza glaberrima TaxID=4538 RepID=I1Q2B6_ORYGL
MGGRWLSEGAAVAMAAASQRRAATVGGGSSGAALGRAGSAALGCGCGFATVLTALIWYLTAVNSDLGDGRR